MGTLQNQPPRKNHSRSTEHLEWFMDEVQEISKRYKVTPADIIAAKHVLELERQNDLYHANGDIFDEQASGLGKIAEDIAHQIGTQNDN